MPIVGPTLEEREALCDLGQFVDRLRTDRRRNLTGKDFTALFRLVAPWPRIWMWHEQLRIPPEIWDQMKEAMDAYAAWSAECVDPEYATQEAVVLRKWTRRKPKES